MKKKWIIAFAFFCAAVILLSISASAVTPQRLIVPAYYDGTAIWNQTYAALTAGDIVIVNPDSGVGASKSSAYTGIVTNLKNKGIVPAGYVYTSNGTRAPSDVKLEIDEYYNWYGVTTIFFDEAATGSSYLPYYQDLYNYVKSRGGMVILNPGTVPNEGYMSVSDVVTVFEDSYSNYAHTSFPAWTAKYSPFKIAVLVYGCPAANLQDAVSQSRAQNAGYVYFTDASRHQWSYLPSYIAAEKALLNGSSPPASPTPAPAPTPTPTLTSTPTLTPAPTPTSTLSPTPVPTPTDYQALYEAALATIAEKDQQIASLNQQMADFKAGLEEYIDTH